MRSLLHHLFLPHSSNNHRPRVLHLDSLCFYAVFLVAFLVIVSLFHREFPTVLGYATDIRAEELLRATNARRQAAGLGSLILSPQLSQAAGLKAHDMFANNYWAHNSPLGKTPWDFILASGYRYSIAGENLAKNFSHSQDVVNAWMASPSHRDNLLKQNYRDIGFAIVNGILDGEETTLVVQMFGTTPSQLAQPSQKQPVLVGGAPQTVRGSEAETPFSIVSKQPLVNIVSLKRDIIFLFVGLLIGVLAVDAFIVAKRRTVRVAGHNVAHLMFFITILVVAGTALSGSIL